MHVSFSAYRDPISRRTAVKAFILTPWWAAANGCGGKKDVPVEGLTETAQPFDNAERALLDNAFTNETRRRFPERDKPAVTIPERIARDFIQYIGTRESYINVDSWNQKQPRVRARDWSFTEAVRNEGIQNAITIGRSEARTNYIERETGVRLTVDDKFRKSNIGFMNPNRGVKARFKDYYLGPTGELLGVTYSSHPYNSTGMKAAPTSADAQELIEAIQIASRK